MSTLETAYVWRKKFYRKPQHPALVASGEVCQAGLGSLYSALFGQSFPAHDALEDVRALRKVLFKSPLNLNKEILVSKSCVMSCESALNQLMYLDRCHVRFQSFISNLYDRNKSKEIITKSMANKIAASGMTYQHLLNLFRQAGTEGLIAVLSMPPSSAGRISGKPRVTRNRRVLSAICSYFTTSV